jgi:hypothetical protein
MAEKYNGRKVSTEDFIKQWSASPTFSDFVETWEPNEKHVENASAAVEKAKAANKSIPTGGTARGQLEKSLKLRRTNINQQLAALGVNAELPAFKDMRAGKKITKNDAADWLADGLLSKKKKK